ncbi:hypothetical protein MBLNU459_g3992t1 [Dothideomycetes sp. NU459]
MEIVAYGSTAIIKRYKNSTVMKCPNPEVADVQSFRVEEQILSILGQHPRIVRFLGRELSGLLFREANCGNLQRYLETHNAGLDLQLRLQWRLQAAEAISYIHSKGVIHSDLRPENLLLHASGSSSSSLPEIQLCDFGGSCCGDIDGGHLPDSGFFNPAKPWVSTWDTDIFSLGSVFYTIMTGHWPHRSPGPFRTAEEKMQYEDKVDELFLNGQFPSVQGIIGGDLIHGCWVEEFRDADTIVSRHKSLIHGLDVHKTSI